MSSVLSDIEMSNECNYIYHVKSEGFFTIPWQSLHLVEVVDRFTLVS